MKLLCSLALSFGFLAVGALFILRDCPWWGALMFLFLVFENMGGSTDSGEESDE